MDIDAASVDHALSTTRAVRRRLDLKREVDQQIILDCIDIAEQAPTGGNLSSRRWLLVRDPKIKDGLAEIYQRSAGQGMVNAAVVIRMNATWPRPPISQNISQKFLQSSFLQSSDDTTTVADLASLTQSFKPAGVSVWRCGRAALALHGSRRC